MDDSSGGVAGYRELRELGGGGGGRVVAAVHIATGREVAIKYLADRLLHDVRFRKAFRAEARVMSELSSPYVVAVYDYLETRTQAAIVMEYVDGTSLASVLEELGPTTPEAALAVLNGSLRGLEVAHERGVVHRDYKPANVMVTRDGVSRLTDFGIAHRSGDAAGRSGTPSYMAPEQWRGAAANPATDVYAATAVFFECLTGRRPYPAENLAQLAMAHASAPIPADQVPPALQQLILRGLAKEPADRPASAQFREELERVALREYGADWERAGAVALGAIATALLSTALGATAGTGAGATVASTASTTTAATGHSAGAGLASPASASHGRVAGRLLKGSRRARSRTVRRLLRTTTGKATAAVAGTGLVAATTVVGIQLAAKPAAHTHPVRAASPAHTAPALAGPGTDCGQAGVVATRQTYLIVTRGRIVCADAFAVLKRYQTGNDPKQGSGAFATFNGWTCGHNSVAGIQSDGQVAGCQTADNGIAFITQFSPTYSAAPTG